MNVLLVLPLLLPLLVAIGSLAMGHARNATRILGLVGALGLFASSVGLFVTVLHNGIQTTQVGAWPFPVGITLVADLFSALMVLLTGVTALTVSLYSLASIDTSRESYGYYALLNVMFMGVCGGFLTGDLFNLFVWFELTLIASFVLLSLGGERAQIDGAIKYVVLNLVASSMLLTAVGILYGIMGTLNLADIAMRWSTQMPLGLGVILATLFIVAFGIKAAVFPLFFWLPASYHTPPAAVSAAFAGLLAKLGVYALIRIFTLLFVRDTVYTHTLLLILAGLSMVVGVLGAIAQNDFRRILAFHSVSQVGYMLMGLALFTPLALGGAIFFILHHSAVKSSLFLVSGYCHREQGSYDIKRLGGLAHSQPVLSVLFVVSAMALAGMPPLSGFFAKLALLQAGIDARQYGIVATALVVSLLTLVSMTKIWTEAFWGVAHPLTESEPRNSIPRIRDGLPVTVAMLPPIGILALLAVAMGLFAENALSICIRAASLLLNRDNYIQAVSGGWP
jgi:multicomponent Na+:H+ antiporter subunit D